MSLIDNSTTNQQQLEKALAEVDALRQQLKKAQRLATVGTMTAMVVHEFNNILTPIINYAQLAKTNPKLMEKAIDKAADGGQRATDICKAILGMTHDSKEHTSVNISQLVAGTISAMAREPQKDCIKLVLDIPADLTVNTRQVELQQVLLNLLINARTAVLAKPPTARKIEISAKKTDSYLHISVADSGIGIEPDNLEKIFQPFFSTKDSQDGKDGHGLGLAICREIIASMGGNISVQSCLDEGAKFIVRLPA